MDIRKTSAITIIEPERNKPERVKAGFQTSTAITADAQTMLPTGVKLKLQELSKKYNLPFDLSNTALDGSLAEKVKGLRRIAEMAAADSKLLPEMIKNLRKLLKAEIKLGQFHKMTVKAAITHQEKIDKQTADIFLAMSGYKAKATKLEHRVNVRNELKQQRTEAYTKHYSESVFGTESELIDLEYQQLAADQKALQESKVERIRLDSERKSRINAYVQSAFQD